MILIPSSPPKSLTSVLGGEAPPSKSSKRRVKFSEVSQLLPVRRFLQRGAAWDCGLVGGFSLPRSREQESEPWLPLRGAGSRCRGEGGAEVSVSGDREEDVEIGRGHFWDQVFGGKVIGF